MLQPSSEGEIPVNLFNLPREPRLVQAGGSVVLRWVNVFPKDATSGLEMLPPSVEATYGDDVKIHQEIGE